MTVVLAVGRLVDHIHHHPEGQLPSRSLSPPQQGKMTANNNLDPSSVTANIVVLVDDEDDVLFLREDEGVLSDSNASSGSLFPSKRVETVIEAPFVLDATYHSDESTSSSAASLQRQSKFDAPSRPAVRFLTDDSDRIVEQVYRYSAVSERRKDKCYMSKSELGDAVEKANQFAESYARLHEDWHGTVESLLLESPGQNDGNDDVNGSNDIADDDTQEAILILTESSARGLEFSSKLLQKHQEWANRSVLRRYYQLVTKMTSEEGDHELESASSPPPSSTLDVSELLRERCEHVNRFTRRLAFQMARGDAIQARIVYQEDDTWGTWK